MRNRTPPNQRQSRPPNKPTVPPHHTPQAPVLPRHTPIVIGRNTVRETLRHAPLRVKQLLLQRSEGAPSTELQEIIDLAAAQGIEVNMSSRDSLTALAGTESHQGAMAVLSERPHQSLKDLMTKLESAPKALILILDSINDPQNLGTLLRIAECFGADAVILPRNRGTPITPAATKASVGASELVNIVTVPNLSEALKVIHDNAYYIITADVAPEAVALPQFKFPDRTVLILGSEAAGPRSLTDSYADLHVHIPLYGHINSLNVSQSAAILCAEYRRQRATESSV